MWLFLSGTKLTRNSEVVPTALYTAIATLIYVRELSYSWQNFYLRCDAA
jgi:hypothetical protein